MERGASGRIANDGVPAKQSMSLNDTATANGGGASGMVSGIGGQMDEVDEKLLNEDFKIWRKNVPFLYDTVMTTALEWPSLTVDWITQSGNSGPKKSPLNPDFTVQRMILGTHTRGGVQAAEANHLLIAEVHLPRDDVDVDLRKFENSPLYVPPKGAAPASDASAAGDGTAHPAGPLKQQPPALEGPYFNIVTRIMHPGEVNRALHMPQDPFKIATKPPSGEVLLFDYSKHPSNPVSTSVKAAAVLTGHRKEGWGLAWHPITHGVLLSGAEDARICVWDVREFPIAPPTGANIDAAASASHSKTIGWSETTIPPTYIFTGHANSVADVAWSHMHPKVFGSVSDDRKMMLWDLRSTTNEKPEHVIEAHETEANCITFNAFSPFLCATGGASGAVHLWDIRKLSTKLHCMKLHRADVVRVAFAPFAETLLGSASSDHRLAIWDLSKIGEEQSKEDEEDGPPELLFVHGGHTDSVADFSWNPNDGCEWVVGSVADDNILQVWQPAETIYLDEESDNCDPTSEDSETTAGKRAEKATEAARPEAGEAKDDASDAAAIAEDATNTAETPGSNDETLGDKAQAATSDESKRAGNGKKRDCTTSPSADPAAKTSRKKAA